MLDFSEVMQQESAKRAADERPDADGDEGKSHVRTLLTLGR